MSRAEKQSRPHFPTHDVGPLVDQERQVPVAPDPPCKCGADDGLRCRPDDIGLGQFTARNHPTVLQFKPVVRDHGAFRGEALDMGGFLFEVTHRNEQRKIGIFVACRFKVGIELALDRFPDPVTPGLDHHAATDF